MYAPAHWQAPPAARYGALASAVRGVRLYRLREVQDMRGDLCAAELGRDLPFVVRRSFLIYNVPNAEVRGEHAHRQCGLGLHLPPMVWGTQYRYSEGAMLLVLASLPYDPADYIRDYGEFLALAKELA